jgi:tRNA pseudouridine38-40 synthase
MRTIKLTLAYDGGAYAGWQAQAKHASLQVTLEQAIARITGEQLRVEVSGRTDAGVHALGQVVSFNTDTHLTPEILQRALNAELPTDMAVVAVEEATPGFHARRHALGKRYRYLIRDGQVSDVFARNYCWQLFGRLDAALMHRAAQPLVGKHDFKSFQTSGSPRASSVRTVLAIDVNRDKRDDNLMRIEVEADGFLYNMVRTIVGTLVQVGLGFRSEAWPAEVLAAANRRSAGQTAPAQGLFLLWVKYREEQGVDGRD